MIIKIAFMVCVVLNVLAEDDTSLETEMDFVINMLLKNEVNKHTQYIEDASAEESIENTIYSNGVWKCGQCDDVDESRLVLTETYDVKTNDDEEDFINLQVGLSLPNISCVMVTSDVASGVRRVRGNCGGEGVTLRVIEAGQYDVKIYE